MTATGNEAINLEQAKYLFDSTIQDMQYMPLETMSLEGMVVPCYTRTYNEVEKGAITFPIYLNKPINEITASATLSGDTAFNVIDGQGGGEYLKTAETMNILVQSAQEIVVEIKDGWLLVSIVLEQADIRQALSNWDNNMSCVAEFTSGTITFGL